MSLRSIAARALVLTAFVALSGCISVLPKSKPAQLYRFGVEAGAPPAAAPGPAILLGRVDFDSAAATDRILTITGNDAAYIEESRWISPAPTLFEEALFRAFQGSSGAPRLIGRGGLLRAPLVLNLDVQSFEARYDQGQEAAPLVFVRVHAVLMRVDDRSVVREGRLDSSMRASDNRVSAIVQAYDAAVKEVLGKLVAFAGGAA